MDLSAQEIAWMCDYLERHTKRVARLNASVVRQLRALTPQRVWAGADILGENRTIGYRFEALDP